MPSCHDGQQQTRLFISHSNPPQADIHNQRRFAKRVSGLCSTLHYYERCARLKIDRLVPRRLYADVILCYIIFPGFNDLSSDKFFAITANYVDDVACRPLIKWFCPNRKVAVY